MTRKALGRGLEALIPKRIDLAATQRQSDQHASERSVAHEVHIDEIKPNRLQPRRRFDDDKLQELAESMRQNAIIQPLLVRIVDGEYELVAGERRLRAARLAGLETVPVLVREDVDDRDSLKLALLENVQRADLNPIEEARGYQRLIAEFGMQQQELAERLGKSRSAVANALRLLNLPEELRLRIESGDLSAGHARALLAAGSLEEQMEIANLVRERGLNVREAEHLAQLGRKRMRKKSTRGNPALEELQKRLESRFGTRVRIRARKSDGSAGRIEIDYYSEADLERVFEIAGVSYLL
jgi:ParB family chromosome partitioning protein